MNLQISSTNMQVSESMKVLAEHKLGKLERIWKGISPESTFIRVVMDTAPDGKFLTKIEVDLNGEVFYSEEMDFELESSLIKTVDEVVRQYNKKKSRTEDWESIREGKILSEEDLEKLVAESEELDVD